MRSTLSRHIFATVGAVALAVPLLGGALIAQADEPLNPDVQQATGTEEDLGRPLVEGLTSHGVGYTMDSDGRALGLLIARGEPSVFSVVDINTGEQLKSEDLPDTSTTWAYSTADDGTVYIGSGPGQIWSFDPDTLELAFITDETFGQTNLWASEISESGRIVWSTYPDGKLISWDPETDDWHDHGELDPGNTYARSLDIVGETAYVGMGTSANIAVADLTTDEISYIDVPEAMDDQEFIYDLDVREGLLFARFTPSNAMHIYDLEQEAWVDETSVAANGLGVSPSFTTEVDGEERTEVLVRLLGQNGGTIAYDVDTGEEREVCNLMGGSGARMWNEVPLTIDGMSDQVLVTANTSGGFFAFDPETDKCQRLDTDAAPAAANIRTMGTGPQGDIYVGGQELGHIDVETDEVTALSQSGQTQSFGAHDGYLLAGIYSSAGIDVYDPTQPRQVGVNPWRVQMGPGQDRTTAFTGMDDGRVAVGSFPVPGRLGGALGVLDLGTREIETWDNLITDQSIYALEYADGLIYGGSGISGGLGVEKTETEGRLFIFDPATGELVYNEIPVTDAGHVVGLAFDDEGMLWGLTGNSLFKFDPETRTVLQHHKYFNMNDQASYVTGRQLKFHDGVLVGSTASTVFEVDPESWDMSIVAEGVINLAIDREGRYYYSKDSRLFRWTPEGEAVAPSCDEVLEGKLNGGRSFVDTNVCVQDAVVTGGLTVSGGSLTIESSRINGGLLVSDAASVTVRGADIRGGVLVTGTAGELVWEGNDVRGSVNLGDER